MKLSVMFQAVLDVERALLDFVRRALVDDLLAHEVELVAVVRDAVGVDGRIAPLAAAFDRLAGDGRVVVHVVTEAEQVVAQLPFGVDAELVALIARVGAVDRAVGQ